MLTRSISGVTLLVLLIAPFTDAAQDTNLVPVEIVGDDATIHARVGEAAGSRDETAANPEEHFGPVVQDPGPGVFPSPDAISPFVRRIFHDSRGHLWFGTNGDGVCRYDGETLEYFSRPEGFGGVAVRGIVEDEEGSVWFGTSGGVTRYDGNSFVNLTVEDGLSHDDVWAVLVDRDGTLWAGTYGGACRLEEGRFVPFAIPPAAEPDLNRGVAGPDLVRSIMQDRAGNLWFATDGGVHVYDGETLRRITEADGLCDDSVNCILEDRNGDIWFATHY